MIVVSDTSPITNLAAIGQLDLLQRLYTSIIIPVAVYDEMVNVGKPVPGAMEQRIGHQIFKHLLTFPDNRFIILYMYTRVL